VIDAHRAGGELAALWSPVSTRLLTVGADPTALLWDVSDPRHPSLLRSLTAPGDSLPNPPNLYVSFTPDGRTVVLNNLPYGHLAAFDVETGRQQWTTDVGSWAWMGQIQGDEVAVTSGAFRGTSGRRLLILDTRTGVPKQTLSPAGTQGEGDLLRDGRLIVVADTIPSADGKTTLAAARLYDAASGQQLGDPLPIGPLPIGVALHGRYNQVSGNLLASPSTNEFLEATPGPDRSVTVWDVDLAHWTATACRIAGRNLTKAEWNQYLPGQPYHTTCPQWPGGQ
jgi:WD40 repeat protein